MTKINIDFDEHKSLRKVLSKFSTGVTVVTCIDKKNNPVGIVVTILCDRGERYFSCL